MEKRAPIIQINLFIGLLSNSCKSRRGKCRELLFHFFIVEKQGEKVLILRKPLDKRVVDAVEIRERKVALGVCFRTLAQFVRLHHQVFNLEHRLDNHVVIVGFARFAVDFVDYLRKAFYLILGQIKVLRRRQFHNRIGRNFRFDVFFALFLNKVLRSDFAR